MSPDRLLELDRELFLLINRVDGPAWELVVGYGTWLGDGLTLAVGLLLGLRWLDRRRHPKNVIVIGLAVLLAGLFVQLLKPAVNRSRPLRDPGLAVASEPGLERRLPAGLSVREYTIMRPRFAVVAPTLKIIGPRLRRDSFPSGHTASIFAAAAALIYCFRSRARWLWLLPASFAGLSRVACGVHFPLDVLAGAGLGAAVAVGFLRSFEIFHGLASPARERHAVVAGTPRILLVAGEASADLYGARVLRALRQREPALRAFGIGGEELREAGLEVHGEAKELEIVGFTGVVTKLATVVRLYRRMIRLLGDERPHVLVCIDLPDFNAMLATQSRARGIPALFFIGPQFWAWRPGRIARLADRISRMIVAFPFEKAAYERIGVPVAFHGHPLAEALEPRLGSREQALHHFGLDPARPTLVLAPGSRRSEIDHLAAELFGAAARIRQRFPEWQLAVPLAAGISAAELQDRAGRAGVEIVTTRGDNYDLFRCCDFGIVCSGTATLEAALAGLPMIIAYRGNPLNHWIARRLVRIDRIGLPNIVLGGKTPLFPEHIQAAARAAPLAAGAIALLEAPERLRTLREACAEVRRRLIDPGPGEPTSRAVADEILDLAR